MTRSIIPAGLRCLYFALMILVAALALSPRLADAFQLDVLNGSGTGSYPAGTVVHVFANPDDDTDPAHAGEPFDPYAPRRVFDHWEGDISSLADPRSDHTTVLMPAADVEISAVYRDAPRWVVPNVLTYFPPGGHTGVLFYFHGGTGTTTHSAESEEVRRFVDDAMGRGLAVVLLNSFDRFEGRWDKRTSAAENVDLQRFAALRESLIAEGRMSEADPLYLAGVSGGGEFVSLFDQHNQAALGISVEAAAMFVAPGDHDVLVGSTLPIIFVAAENDSEMWNLAIARSFEMLLGNGVPTQLWMHRAGPIEAARLARSPALTLADGELIVERLRSAGMIDEAGYMTAPVSQLAWAEELPPEYAHSLPDISEQLLAGNGEHWFMSDFNRHVLDFFEAPTTRLPDSPVISGISPQSGLPGQLVVVSGEGFFDVRAVRFGAISAVFETLTDQRIAATVPQGALTGPITVVNAAGQATSVQDFVVPAPRIDSLDPTTGWPGQLVTIEGSGFDAIESVTFGPASATASATANATVISAGPTWLVVQIPTGATSGPVQVTNRIGTASSAVDFVVAGPQITGFSPAGARVGAVVTVEGSGFADVESVEIGAVPAPIHGVTGSSVWISVPAGATTGRITVRTPVASATSADELQVYLPPVVESFSPDKGPVGSSVTIFGEHLSSASSVKFGFVETSFVVESDSRIRATVPDGFSRGRIRVTTAGGSAASASAFKVTR